MSATERLLWRFHRPLGWALLAINALPIGERRVAVGDDILLVDSTDRLLAALGWKLGLLGRAERRFIATTVRPGMTAVDVGANVGLHTLAFARLVGATGSVHALEPDPDNFRCLEGAVRNAATPVVHLHRVAALDQRGRPTLHRSRISRGEHSLRPLSHPTHPLQVDAVPLDELLADEPRVDIIKLDVQGAETAALAGARRIIAANPQITVLCEVCPQALVQMSSSADELFALVADLGLEPHTLGANGTIQPAPAHEASAAAVAAGYLDLVLRRRDGRPCDAPTATTRLLS